MDAQTGLTSLSQARTGKRGRESSYDRTGGNKDFFTIKPGDNTEICRIRGAGAITHIWMTMAPDAPVEEAFLPRKIVLRMYWDGETEPSVEAPIGDFFGMGHGLTRNYASAALMMSPEDGKAFNCFFRMPYATDARIEIGSEAEHPIKFYFYIDYEAYDKLPDNELRFHAKWNRENPTDGIPDAGIDNADYEFGGNNTTGDGNYVILEAEGIGHYIGCNFNVHNLRATREWNWYGEGDDMIFIDGEPWPPTLHGTGMEDYFNTAWCPQQEYLHPLPRHHYGRRSELERQNLHVPIPYSRSDHVREEHQGYDRARA